MKYILLQFNTKLVYYVNLTKILSYCSRVIKRLIRVWDLFLNFFGWLVIIPPKPHSYNTLCLHSGVFSPLVEFWSLIKLGFYYAKKIENPYLAKYIGKICKKLKIKITIAEINQDLYFSTEFGPLYYYRSVKGFIGTSFFFFILNKLFWVSGLLIYLSRNHLVEIHLNKYLIDEDNFIIKYFNLDFLCNYSALYIVEFIFLIGMILKIFFLLFKLFTLADSRVSIGSEKSNLLPKLTKKQRKIFFIGVNMFSLLSWLGLLSRMLFYYLIVCNLDIIPSFIKIKAIFVFVEKIMDIFFKSCGFTPESIYPLVRFNEKVLKLYRKYWKD